jgi:Zn-dependent peptidase ImmA (M78 family)/transcriptional regulator with XRE-family HTH domain
VTDRATAINPGVLTWARDRAGLSLPDVAHYMHKDVDDVAAWEVGAAWPTYKQLEKLAEGLYHRPVALFFLPEPPEEPAAQQEFRALPDFDVTGLGADTRFAARLGRSYQASLRELTGGLNPSGRLVWRDLRPDRSSDVVSVAQQLRNYLGVSLERQRSWRSTADAMAAWRSCLEDAGVFVFKRSFKQRKVSGFCLTDDEFPIIMVNNSTPFSRQIFTLFHEVAHLLYGLNGITTVDGHFVDRMSGSQKSVEVACNRLAAEFLVPTNAFPWGAIDRDDPVDSVSAVARAFNVSREVILRRVLDRGWIDSDTYRDLVQAWASQTEAGRGGDGGDYYNNQAAYLGDAYLRLAFSQYRAGIIDVSDLSEHLGVKARNISKLEEKVASRI